MNQALFGSLGLPVCVVPVLPEMVVRSEEARPAVPSGLVAHPPHALLHHLDIVRGNALLGQVVLQLWRILLNHGPVLFKDTMYQPRLVDESAIGHRSGHAGHLHGRGLHEPLADRRHRRVGAAPVAALHFHPIRAGHGARTFARDLDSGGATKAEQTEHGLHVAHPGNVGVLVEKTVARVLDRRAAVDAAVPVAFAGDPAFHVVVAVVDTPTAVEATFLSAVETSCERGGDFRSRSRIVWIDRPIEHWTAGILDVAVVVLGIDRGNELVWIERGHRGNRQHITGLRIGDHGSPAADGPQRILSDHLNARIDGQVDVRSRLGRFVLDIAGLETALDVTHQHPLARLPLEQVVHGFSIPCTP